MKSREIKDHLLFIRLLAELHPNDLYDFVSKTDGMYPLDETLAICRERNIKDAAAYLLDRMGNLDAALDLIIEHIDDIRSRNRNGVKTETVPVEETLKQSAMEHAVEVAIRMCERNSLTNLDESQAQKMWFHLLEKLILNSSFAVQDTEKNRDEYADVALRKVLHRMMPHVDSQDLLKLIRNKPFGLLKNTVVTMVDAKHVENNMLKMASRIIAKDMLNLVKAKHEKLNHAVEVDTPAKLCVDTAIHTDGSLSTPIADIQNDNEVKKHPLSLSSGWYTDWDQKLNALGSVHLTLDPPPL
mmetsp:Transcript_4890/g.5582  ORF Transcript_4890/g.5582 Transcript_4890/m.5582 type:complete len:299 (+) Transcript_4890:3-899(+)